MTVNSSYGTNSAFKDKYIYVGDVPRADFQADVLSGIAPHPVKFTDLSRGNPTSWYWDFGDGATSTDKNPNHTYKDSGYYNVTLKVSNAYGESTLVRGANGEKVWLEDSASNNTPGGNGTVNNTPAPPAPPTTPEEPETGKSRSSLWTILIIAIIIIGLVAIGGYLYMQKKKK
ncbi:MAG: PKD domain-containing protein [Methanimicrococcus sp.]|nr:PKD domain-containing protein [Methanimicrococcus sp.]